METAFQLGFNVMETTTAWTGRMRSDARTVLVVPINSSATMDTAFPAPIAVITTMTVAICQTNRRHASLQLVPQIISNATMAAVYCRHGDVTMTTTVRMGVMS